MKSAKNERVYAQPATTSGSIANSQRQQTNALIDTAYIFKPNTGYVFRVTHQDANIRDVDVYLSVFDNSANEPIFG